MSDLISRQAVLDLFAEKCDTVRPYHEVWYAVKDLPSVEPERKPGKWIDISRDDDMGEFYCCSLCKREIILYPGETLKDYPYCHCGARMEVEDEDSN